MNQRRFRQRQESPDGAAFARASRGHRAAASFRDDGQVHGVVIGTDRPKDVRVEGDPGRLHQVRDILLLNALKFTPRGGHVFVRADRAEGGVVVIVEDTGRGHGAAFRVDLPSA